MGAAAGRSVSVPVLAALLLAVVSAAVPHAAEAQEEGTHEVRRGDTLWDLAGRYLSDPFDWRRIYELNRERIDDPHWIYPGQRFRLPGAGGEGRVTEVEVTTRDGAEAEATEARTGDAFSEPSIFDRNPEQAVTVSELEIGERTPPPLVSASDFYGVPFLTDFESLRPRGTTRRVLRENPLELDLPPTIRIRDRVIIGLEDLRPSEGDTLQAVRQGRELDELGDVVHSLALLEVREVGADSARAVVTALFGPYEEGDPVLAAEPYGAAGAIHALREDETGLAARIAGLAVDQTLVGTGDLLFLDVGSDRGVAMGDEFAVFPEGTESLREARGEDRLGVVRVVRTRPHSATARVVGVNDVGLRPGLPAWRVRRPAPPDR